MCAKNNNNADGDCDRISKWGIEIMVIREKFKPKSRDYKEEKVVYILKKRI